MTHRILKLFLIPLLLTSCQGTIPVWKGKIYAGDPRLGAIVRMQENEIISCQDVRFSGFTCMSYLDFKSFYETYVLGCKKWKSGMKMMTVVEAWAMLKIMEMEDDLQSPPVQNGVR